MTIARQRLGKHNPEVTLSTIGHPLQGNERINTHSWHVIYVFRGVRAEELQEGTEGSTTGSVVELERERSESSAGKDEGFGWILIVSSCNWLWLRVIVQEGVSKSNHPIQNPLLLVTEPRTRDSMKPAFIFYYYLHHCVLLLLLVPFGTPRLSLLCGLQGCTVIM
jgi:hypothetical protein